MAYRLAMNVTTSTTDVKRVHVSRPKPVNGYLVQRVTAYGINGDKHIHSFLLPIPKQAKRK